MSLTVQRLFQACHDGDIAKTKECLQSGVHVDSRDPQDEEGNTPLHLASEKQNVKLAELLLHSGATVDAKDKWDRTPLHLASMNGSVEVAELLLNSGATVDAKKNNDRTPLHLASLNKHMKVAELLLHSGATVDAKDESGITPLHLSKNVEVAELLLNSGAIVDAKDKWGRTPLHRTESKEVADLLLSQRTAVDANDMNGNTPLILASYGGHRDIVTILLEKGADPNLQDKNGRTALIAACEQGHGKTARTLLEAGVDISKKTENDDTAFHEACRKGLGEIVMLMLEANVAINMKNKDGETPLILASCSGDQDTVRNLLEKGADPILQDKNDQTPLHHASIKGKVKVAELLLSQGAAVNAKDQNGWTPLYFASRQGEVEVVELLLRQGATVNPKSKGGWTPLMLASRNNHKDTAILLLKHHADLNVQGEDGKTPLILSIDHDHHSIAEILLEKGANPNLQDKYSKTALHYASEKGMVKVVRVLLQKGVAVDAQDDDGTTVLMNACRQGHGEIARILVEAGADINKKNQYGWTALSVSRVRVKEIITAAVLERRDHHTDPNYPDIHFYSKPFKAVVTSEGQNVAFDDIGLTMIVPPGAVPEDTQLDVTVRPCLSGPFILPEGYQPVSPPYLITASCHLTLEVKMSIEHFAELRQEEDSKSLVFLRARSKCSNRKYKFEEVPREKFSFTVGKRTGVVSLKDFSLYWIVRAISALIWGENAYSLRLYRSPNPSPDEVKAFFCVTLMQQLYIKNLETEVRSQFPSFHEVTVEEPVYLYEEKMTVDIPSRVKGWSVEYDRSPVVTRHQMDLPLSNPDYTQFSRYPPTFHLRVLPTLEEHNQMRATSCSFSVKGLKEAPEFTLFLPRILTTPAGTSEMSPEVNVEQDSHITEINGSTYAPLREDILPILLDQLQNAASKWRDVGVYLGFGSGALDNIQSKPSLYTEGAPGFLRELMIQWLKWAPPDHSGPTVGNLVSALRRAGESKMALELRQELLLSWIATSTAHLLSWITTSTAQLIDAPLPGVRPENIEACLKVQKALESTAVSHEPSVSSLRQAGEKLLTSTYTENTAKMQQDILDMSEKWENLRTLAAERSNTLTASLERARSFDAKWKTEHGWLSDAERHAQDWKPCGLSETSDADITRHKAFLEEVQSHRDSIDALKVEGEEIKGQGSHEEQKMVDQWVRDIVQRWLDLCGALKDRQAQLQEAKGKAEEFNKANLAVRDKVAHFEKIQEKWEPICSEVEAVKQQLETHNEHLKDLKDLEGDLNELEEFGHLLSKGCVRSDGEVILQRIADLRSYANVLSTVAVDRHSSLKECLLSLRQFDGAYDELWGALRKLDEAEPITGDPELVAAQLSKYKDLQKQLGAQMSSCSAVMKAGQELINQITGQDNDLLKKKLEEVEQEWERVCQLLVERQERLQQAYQHLEQFRSHLGPLQSWMTKVLPILDESEPIQGDIDFVGSLIAGHASFQKDLDSNQKNINTVNTIGDHLVTKVLDDPTVIRQNLQELNEMWEYISQQSVRKQERLDSAYKSAKQFDSQNGKLQIQHPPDKDATIQQKQTDEHKSAKQFEKRHVDSHIGKLQTQPPPDKDATIQHKPQSAKQFQKRHVDSHNGKLQTQPPPDKVATIQQKQTDEHKALGEDVASIQPQFHEDMLEKLWQWVGEAEAKMAETETTPIGSNLEVVEQQLAEHEGFQKEMASHQPSIDALNKANKSKAAHLHANPEITKRINSLFERWQKLSLQSSAIHQMLLDAHTRLNNIALARSFNFEAWKKQFLDWAHQRKLKVVDCFRKFDGNNDGMLTREEFMKGLKASGMAMNQVELEMTADAFDRDHDGMINLSEIMPILKGTHRPRGEQMSDDEKIEQQIQHEISKCTCPMSFKVARVGDGQYRFGDFRRLCLVRIPRCTVTVRVGGGWMPLADFLHKHDPCRASPSKRQNAAAAKSTAMKMEAKKTASHTHAPKK